MFNDIETNELLLVKKSLYFPYEYKKIMKHGSILLVLENNFGATFKNRSLVCLMENNRITFDHFFLSNYANESCFEMLKC